MMEQSPYPATPLSSTEAELAAEIERLQRENENLRGQNARLLRHLLDGRSGQPSPKLVA